jgi:hypothetical protein
MTKIGYVNIKRTLQSSVKYPKIREEKIRHLYLTRQENIWKLKMSTILTFALQNTTAPLTSVCQRDRQRETLPSRSAKEKCLIIAVDIWSAPKDLRFIYSPQSPVYSATKTINEVNLCLIKKIYFCVVTLERKTEQTIRKRTDNYI